MDDKTMQVLTVAGVVLLLLMTLFSEKQISLSAEKNKISVSGTAETEAMPDEVVLSFTVLTEGNDAKKVQEQNSHKMNSVIAGLREAGIKDKEIETTGYNLYPWQEWDPSLQKSVEKGYRLQQTISVTTKATERAGELVTLAVQNGVNTVNGISFRLSSEKEQEVREQLVEEASAKAREKAESLARSLGVSVGDVLHVTESGFPSGPWYFDRAMKSGVVLEAAVPEISPEQIKLSLQVNVDFAVE
ncbi:SIMPL domain-containing protein [Candidatus Woesearchaeota archaeon]|nr:SIMPL domain-containing protein [Candidatus Woesearchaeota archaeon]